MPDGSSMPLSHMRPGQSGVIIDIKGGFGLINRLNAQGIVPGKRVRKISAMIARGPVTIEVDRVQVAVGFGMAQRIMIALDR